MVGVRPMKTLMTLLIAVGALAVGFVQQATAADEEQATTITIEGQTYTVVPDGEFRKLGFNVPDVKAEDNAANDYLKAIDAYHPLERGDPLDRLRDEVMRSGWTEDAGPLAEYIERNEKVLELLRAAASKEVCHFPALVPLGSTLEETSPAGIMLPHLSKMRELARFLVTVGKSYEFEERYADALDTYLLVLRLGNHVSQEPFLISGLVGMACNAIGARAIDQSLVRSEIDEEALARVHKRLAELAGGRPSAIVSMRGERAWATSIVEYLIRHPELFADFVDVSGEDGHGKVWQLAMTAMLRSDAGRAQIRADVKAFWDAMDKAIAMPLPEYIRTDAGDEPVNNAKARKAPPNIMALLGPALSRARMQFARNDLAWTVLDVDFALARYAGKHGQYPESLDALKDLMLSDGTDPYSGKPLHYRLEDDGAYTVWSVGENLEDDGGEVGSKCPDWQAKDFVWNSAVIHGEE